jgi:ADP-ribosylglycohydrolase
VGPPKLLRSRPRWVTGPVPVDTAAFVASMRAVVTDPLLAARLDLAGELTQHRNAGEIDQRIGTGLSACESVPAANRAFLCHPDSFPDAVVLAISLGGDADSIASMTGAISGALLGETSIPTRWLERTIVAARDVALADALYSVVVQH